MRITPLDVRKQEFRKGMRGLDPEEVYAFLATVADEYETVLTDNRQLRDRVLELDEKVSEYRNMEKTLRDTLLTAERVMGEARENARKEAELILRDARGQAQHESQSSVAKAEALRAQLRELRTHRDAFLARLRGLAETQIGLVESFAHDFEEDDRGRTASAKPATETYSQPQSPPRSQELSGPQGYSNPQDASGSQPLTEPQDYSGPQNSFEARAQQLEAETSSEPSPPHEPDSAFSAEDHWREYKAGAEASAISSGDSVREVEEHVARTVVEMAQAAGAESGQGLQSMPPSPDSGAEFSSSFGAGMPEEEPVPEASAEGSEEDQRGSRWSISRFTRSLSEF
jgi:cell division initiation protein